MSKGRFLVTGEAGFIGSHLVRSLLADGYRVEVIDNLNPFDSCAMKKGNLFSCRDRGAGFSEPMSGIWAV